ncbi:MAG: hypothetical protein ACLQME_20600, partial [Alphaproteobacteria bacterium]
MDIHLQLVIPDKQIIAHAMICAIRNPFPRQCEREAWIPDSKARNREKLRFSRARLSFRNDAKLECPQALGVPLRACTQLPRHFGVVISAAMASNRDLERTHIRAHPEGVP